MPRPGNTLESHHSNHNLRSLEDALCTPRAETFRPCSGWGPSATWETVNCWISSSRIVTRPHSRFSSSGTAQWSGASACRVLGDHHDAEEAFQATFLALARKAASVSPRTSVGNWLHGVARRTALKVKADSARRRARERQLSEEREVGSLPRDAWLELVPILDQELGRLPERYRSAIVLCDLEGRTRSEAARQLGWPEGTVASRLARGRELPGRPPHPARAGTLCRWPGTAAREGVTRECTSGPRGLDWKHCEPLRVRSNSGRNGFVAGRFADHWSGEDGNHEEAACCRDGPGDRPRRLGCPLLRTCLRAAGSRAEKPRGTAEPSRPLPGATRIKSGRR